MANTHIHSRRLPTERGPKEAVRIYLLRLAVLMSVALVVLAIIAVIGLLRNADALNDLFPEFPLGASVIGICASTFFVIYLVASIRSAKKPNVAYYLLLILFFLGTWSILSQIYSYEFTYNVRDAYSYENGLDDLDTPAAISVDSDHTPAADSIVIVVDPPTAQADATDESQLTSTPSPIQTQEAAHQLVLVPTPGTQTPIAPDTVEAETVEAPLELPVTGGLGITETIVALSTPQPLSQASTLVPPPTASASTPTRSTTVTPPSVVVASPPELVFPPNGAIVDSQRIQFRWRWEGTLEDNWGFQILGSNEHGEFEGIMDARRTMGLQPSGGDIYLFEMSIPPDRRGTTWSWSVVVGELSPVYRPIGSMADPHVVTTP